jgi:hypothetical protein
MDAMKLPAIIAPPVFGQLFKSFCQVLPERPVGRMAWGTRRRAGAQLIANPKQSGNRQVGHSCQPGRI